MVIFHSYVSLPGGIYKPFPVMGALFMTLLYPHELNVAGNELLRVQRCLISQQDKRVHNANGC
jgi:hypothetical protein